ncbi:MAG: AraC family transcriptional regulator [Cytophagaceae bacterium]|nr:AraC family transcriptional regulator [Cytophagaceae bacterium]
MNVIQLHIKNMVCPRCIKVVKEELTRLGLRVKKIQLGKVAIAGSAEFNREEIAKSLEKEGFELIKDQDEILIEMIKLAVIELIHHNKKMDTTLRNSEYISQKLGESYSALSKLFSKYEKVTLEKYIIRQKIERAKELLEYGELTLGEIALQLGYSNVHYLSTQFKTITGMSVSEYKNNERRNLRKFICDI